MAYVVSDVDVCEEETNVDMYGVSMEKCYRNVSYNFFYFVMFCGICYLKYFLICCDFSHFK